MFNLKPLSLVMTALTLTACGSDNDKEVIKEVVEEVIEEVVEEPGPYTFYLQESGEGNPEYLITQDDISVEVLSAENVGIEQLGWNFSYNVGNTLFISGYRNYETISYRVDASGEVSQLSSFLFDSSSVPEMFGSVDGNVLLATDIGRGGAHTSRTLYTVNAETGNATSKISYSLYDEDTGTPGEGVIAAPTALVVRDNLLYIPFQKLGDDGDFGTPDPDGAYVAIYNYPLVDGDAPIKVIEDTRAPNIGVNGSASGMVTAENGDLYTQSSGAKSAGFAPASTLPSAILRINKDETEFDANYYFNVEEATDGGKIFWMDYIGDDKVIARIITDEYATDETGEYALNEAGEKYIDVWSAYTKSLITQKLVIIDLVNQTIVDVDGVPLHSKQYTGPIEVIDGTVYVSIETGETAYVYAVDIDSATAVQGAEIEGRSIKGFYDLYN